MQADNDAFSDHHDEGAFELSAQDREVLDSIFGVDPGSFVPTSDRDHASVNLLGLLGTGVEAESQRPSRIDVVSLLASRLKQHDLDAGEGDELTLCEADQLALDQYINAGYCVQSVEADLRPRVQRLEAMGASITSGHSRASSDLIERTLATIQTHIDAQEATMRVADREGSGGFSFRWTDLISIAAMLLLAASVVMPVMSGVRANAQQAICFDNMHGAASAFGMYTGSNRDMLPMATAGFGPTWIDVGTTPERSNSSNLYTLIRTGMASLDDLACPSNPGAARGEADPDAWDWRSLGEISYSYRIMPPGGMRASSAQLPVRVVLLADRSPVVLRAARGQRVRPEENSPNHSQAGQHMLMLDGSSVWASTPVLESRDNIWLPRPIETLIHNERVRRGINITGTEQPGGPTDAFVGP